MPGIIASRDLEALHVDAQNVFLNGDLEEELYMEQTEGFAVHKQEDLVASTRAYMGSSKHPEPGTKRSTLACSFLVSARAHRTLVFSIHPLANSTS